LTNNSSNGANNSPATDEEAIALLRNLLLPESKEEAAPAEDEISQLRSLLSIEPASPQDTASAADELSQLRELILKSEPNPTSNVESQEPNNNKDRAEDPLAELRQLLFNREQVQLGELQERLDNPQLHAEDLSKVLPEAIMLLSLQRQGKLTKAITPTVEDAIQLSIKQDINIIANAIFPVIGPAIRKAINVAISTLVQSLNQTLEHSLSPQSFRWRLEAKQTGKSFAEVVLLRTLLYRVEQVFLIHKNTSLVLQHIVAELVAAQDADLVSAMLRAIQDFVQDSFNVQQGDGLETLRFGELTVWIEEGSEAILAGVIRGNAPQELRLVFQDVIEKIHNDFRPQLTAFTGDNQPFEASRDYLEECLQAQYAIKKEKSSPLLPILGGSVVVFVAAWWFVAYQASQRWEAYIETLNQQPGMVVTGFEKRHGKYQLFGLRDPLAADPLKILQTTKINPKAVVSHWEPYLSFEPSIFAARINQILKPPPTVSLKVDENGVLSARGSANQKWIVDTQTLVKAIPGITKYNDQNLIQIDYQQLQILKQNIEKQTIIFETGNSKLIPEQEQKLKNIAQEIEKLSNAAPLHNKDAHIQIVGHTSYSGAEDKNLLLSQNRAYTILSKLKSQGLNNSDITAVGVGAKQPLPEQDKQSLEKINRSVTFKVFLTDKTNSKVVNR
jgi:outer membrane protein OmpA-like peptidoglycan-associated protein